MKIYLATPYSGTLDQKVSRFKAVNKVAARLMREGNLVFSPISHTHPIALAGELPGDWMFWKEYDRTFIEWCDEVHVLKQDGWEDSVGIRNEIMIAAAMEKPVRYIDA